jgi:peptidylprolyl isomerase
MVPMVNRRGRGSRGVALLVVALVLSSCGFGDSEEPAPSETRLDAVSIAGEVGSEPQVSWSSAMSASDVEAETVVVGTGPRVPMNGAVLAQVWIGDGTTQTEAYSSFGGAAQLVTPGDDDTPALRAAVSGATVGSRVAVTASAAEAFGAAEGRPALGIGGSDSVVVVVDVLSAVASGPSGTQLAAPAGSPAVVVANGRPAALDFSATPAPVGKFQKTALVAGGGVAVEKDMTVVIRYLGQVYGAAEPFADNYTTAPTTFRVGSGEVIEAWDKMVRGTTVGSRILVEAPPKLTYGTAGRPDLGITGTDTLYYVLDVVAAA